MTIAVNVAEDEEFYPLKLQKEESWVYHQD
jgi:hypothetical protein